VRFIEVKDLCRIGCRINRSVTLPNFTKLRECIAFCVSAKQSPYLQHIMAQHLPRRFAYAEIVNIIDPDVFRLAS